MRACSAAITAESDGMVQPGSGPALAAERCDGRQLTALYAAAFHWLGRHAARVDALNVFPVPDGDTGTNMRLTLEAAVRAIEAEPSDHAGEVALRAGQAALLGARGNSGVILSQVLGGLAAGLRELPSFDSRDLAAAAEEAVRFAYRAVSKPVEGTMLTVIREVAAELRAAATAQANLPAALRRAAAAARATIRRTPELLPMLRAAGVVDAGAEGLGVILDGMLRRLDGQSLTADMQDAIVRPNATAMAEGAHALDDNGYCTNYLVRLTADGAEGLRAEILALGTSAVIADAGGLIKVHLHTERPWAALEAGARRGELTAIEIVNMRDQVAALRGATLPTAPARPAAGSRDPGEATAMPLVAVAPSRELEAVFAGFGAVGVIGGQTMNPSVGQLLEAIRRSGAEHVFVLPNNGNVILTAQEAVRLAQRPATVIPTRSVPQGVAAAVAFLPERPPEENAEAMASAARTVTTIEVTTASRSCTLDGRLVAAGQAIALVDDVLTVATGDAESAALAAIRQARRPDHSLLTLYRGQGVGQQQAEALAEQLKAALPGLDLELVAGGQPHYPYLAALE